jgi:hypothetical protein
VVDAADYVVWRKGFGTIYTENDFNIWRAHFGQSFISGTGSGASANAVVPEPATIILLLVAATGVYFRRTRTA